MLACNGEREIMNLINMIDTSCNITTTNINTSISSRINSDYSMEKKILQFKKLYQSLEDIETNLGELNKYKKEGKKTLGEENKMFHLNERSDKYEFSSFLTNNNQAKTVKFKDLEDARQNELSDNEVRLKKEILKIKGELNDLREDNSQLYAKTNSLETNVDDLQTNLSKSLQKSGTIENSFDKIDNRFFEINKILTDLNESKALLQKTSYISPAEHSIIHFDPHLGLQAKENLNQSSTEPSQLNSSSYKIEKNLNSLSSLYSELKKATYLNNYENSNSTNNNNTNNCNSNTSQTTIPIHNEKPILKQANFETLKSTEPTGLLRISKEKSSDEKAKCSESENLLKKEFESLRRDLEKAKLENYEIKRKMLEIEKAALEKKNQTEVIKNMYNRALNGLKATNEVEYVNIESRVEQQEITIRDDESIVKQYQALKATMSKLNDENYKLQCQLDRIKEVNRNELNKLKNELDQMRENHSNELKIKSKACKELQTELSNLKIRIKHEESQKEELKIKCLNEINSAKIRFENELGKQNSLMQSKYDELIKEINKLNQTIKKLTAEKNELLLKIQKEKRDFSKYSRLSESYNDLTSNNVKPLSPNIFSAINTYSESKNQLFSSMIIYDTKENSYDFKSTSTNLSPVKYVSSFTLSPLSKSTIQLDD